MDVILHGLTTFYSGLNYLFVNLPWSAIAASGILSPALLAIKKWQGISSEKVMITLVALGGLVAATADYLMNAPIHDPSVIAIRAAVVAFLSQPFYFFIVKPLVEAVAIQMAKARAFDEQVKSAQEPAGGLTPADFSQ